MWDVHFTLTEPWLEERKLRWERFAAANPSVKRSTGRWPAVCRIGSSTNSWRSVCRRSRARGSGYARDCHAVFNHQLWDHTWTIRVGGATGMIWQPYATADSVPELWRRCLDETAERCRAGIDGNRVGLLVGRPEQSWYYPGYSLPIVVGTEEMLAEVTFDYAMPEPPTKAEILEQVAGVSPEELRARFQRHCRSDKYRAIL